MTLYEQCVLALGEETPKPGQTFDMFKVRELLFEMAKRTDRIENFCQALIDDINKAQKEAN
jgi:hypothetical protein